VLTRCPACETHFRVTAEQLKARSGRVRCGECQHIFNALDSLIEEPMLMAAPPVAEAAPPDVAPSLSDADEAPAAAPAAKVDEIAVPPAPALCVPSGTFEPIHALTQDEQRDISTSSPPEMEGPPAPEAIDAAEPGGDAPATTEPETVEPVTAEPEAPDWSETFPEPPPPPRRWPWAIGSLVALATLGLQAALAFRVELAILSPETKPALIALCDIADCEVGLPAKVGLVGIEASDLHPDTEGRLSLTATLKNRAPFAQQYPHLELTLTDTADKAIARKVLAPADYLPPKTTFANGMPPNADIMVAIGVDPGEMAASGYRLYLFYP
jgi:predicted Zn finger-like uncharacterized protein